jgi:hypothetical protein
MAQIHLALGRALLAENRAKNADYTLAKKHLDEAVRVFGNAGHQVHLPKGLLARVDLHET